MPRVVTHPKAETFNLRVDPKLKAEFQAATSAADKPAAQVLREFMRAYVERRRRAVFALEAARQSRIIATAVGEDADAMAWVEDASDTDGWTA